MSETPARSKRSVYTGPYQDALSVLNRNIAKRWESQEGRFILVTQPTQFGLVVKFYPEKPKGERKA